MSKVRLILLSMLAVFAASAVASASAAAAGCEEAGGEKCLWTLEGKILPAGEMRELKVVPTATFTLKGKASGAKVTLKSTEIDLKEAKILGGNPGTNYGSILFKNVTVSEPKECKVTNKEVITEPLKSELVELVKGKVPQKVDDLLFEPEKAGGVFAKIAFENNPKCSLAGVTAEVAGNIQSEPSPRNTETVKAKLKTQGKEEWEFRRKGETVSHKSQLEFGGEPATLEGTAELELIKGEKWGTD